ncbi:MAG: NAD-dependent epimerase/dehydratase family protein [Cyclobacteriaceae bacterium]
MKRALILGAGGFIGNHMVNRLKSEGFWVRGADIKNPEFSASYCDEFIKCDLRLKENVDGLFDQSYDEVYQFAADMGGAGYIFTGEHDADVMYNSAMINMNVLNAMIESGNERVFYSSSACIYPKFNQKEPDNPICSEESAYPAEPDSEYGWEKLFSERLFASYARNYGLECRVARYHNIYGPEGAWRGGREKAPAAICRKVAEAKDNEVVEVWGNGRQTRSFLFIDDCIEGTIRLMRSDHQGPFNIGSEEMVTINGLTEMVIELSGKTLAVKNVEGPVGVMGRNSDNTLMKRMTSWEPKTNLKTGMKKTYDWVSSQFDMTKKS